MDVYGLTGGIGSGKSSVASLLESYGIPVVSADELSRMVVAKGSESLAAVEAAFGPEVLDENGELDRPAMARIVFSDPEKRKQLESILHPRIRERFAQVLEALESAGHEVAVYEVPLLFEKNLQADMRAVILVTASVDTRVARVMARDGVGRDQVVARMKTQMPEAEKRKLADYVIENEGELDDLRREVEILVSRFLKVPGSPRARLLADETPSAGTPVPAADAVPSSVDTVISYPPDAEAVTAEASDAPDDDDDDDDDDKELPPSRVRTIPPDADIPQDEDASLEPGGPRLPPPPPTKS